MADEKAQAEQADETRETDAPQGASTTQRSAEELRRDLLDAIGDLRAEVARLRVDEARTRIQQWVRENPTLAVFLATGAGILAGRLVTQALTPAPPPPLTERARQRARLLASEAQRRASDVGKGVAERAATAGREAQQRTSVAGEQLSRQAREWGTTVAEQARQLGANMADEDVVGKAVAERADRAAQAVRASTQGTTDTMRAGYQAARFGWKAAKMAFAVLMATKSAKWIRKIV